MFFSCIKENNESDGELEETVGCKLKSGLSADQIQTLDAFVFKQDGTLDCYQRIEHPGSTCGIASGSGKKRLLLIANSCTGKYGWADIRNLHSAALLTTDLEIERRMTPLMSCLIDIQAGEEILTELHPLRSEILLQTLRCDFSGRSYAGEKLTDIKVYLTYANASCNIIPEVRNRAFRLINPGMLDEHHLKKFKEQDLMMQALDEDVGREALWANCSLFCYCNEPEEESIGSPLTKLVIEGKIGGDTYYYPIRINPYGGGVAPGGKYVFDITLKRAGATDPDGNLEEEDIEINMEIVEWETKEWYDVEF